MTVTDTQILQAHHSVRHEAATRDKNMNDHKV